MKELRHVLFGVGAGILEKHMEGLSLPDSTVVGGWGIDDERNREAASELGCPFYTDYRQMLAETKPDIAVIMTPHPFHAEHAVACFEAGVHVLVEKPMAITVAEADVMIEAAQKADKLLCVNFQFRLRPQIRAAAEFIRSGGLGQIHRVELTAAWPRCACYFNSAPWRATWGGEGGGVLMNQAPHDLDVLGHLLGMPDRVFAWTPTAFHDIEVEDTVHAILKWDEGTMGYVHISTAEGGKPRRLQLCGDKGILDFGDDSLTFTPFENEVRPFLATNQDMWGNPGILDGNELPLPDGEGDHREVYRLFHEAVRNGGASPIDGPSSRISLEITNAMYLSSSSDGPVSLPLERGVYDEWLSQRRAAVA